MTSGLQSLCLLVACASACLARSSVHYLDDRQGKGRRFDGIGGLSGGGATSKLLVNYPQEQRDQILDYLFKPNFGASLHMLKVEIGGDAQSTDGTEASHMHNSWDENYQRGYEWWLLTEAKKRNPDILLYCLPWAFPAWVGNGTRDPYHSPNITAGYVIKFIQGAKKYYNLTFDYVGIWNERPYSPEYIKTLRSMLDKADLKAVKIVASDATWEPIAADVMVDKELSDAVDAIGTHYPGTKSSGIAMATEKPLWSSEDYSTFNDNVGGGCWARILNQNYVNGHMTSTISWNLIASYYNALPYTRNGLMTAVSPWSGNYVVESPIWVTAHTTQFTKPGWSYLADGAGVSLLKQGGSIVTLVSPDNKDMTVVIETMSRNHSICVRPFLPEYNVSAQNITLQFGGSFASLTKLNVWHTKLGFNGAPTTLFTSLGSFPVVSGKLLVTLQVDEMYTLTTLDTGVKGEYSDPPPAKPFPLPYSDNFDSYAEFKEPFNFAQQVGSYEVATTSDPAHGKVLRQVVLENPIFWCLFIDLVFPIGVVGDFTWSDIYVEVDVKVGPVNGTEGVFVAARVDKGGCNTFEAQGIYFFIFPSTKSFQVTGDLARAKMLKEGNSSDIQTSWNNLALLVKDGNAIGTLNGKPLFEVPAPETPTHGFVALGSSSYGLADYDNLKIRSSSQGVEELSWKQKEIHQEVKQTIEEVVRINEETVFVDEEIEIDNTLRFKSFKKTKNSI